MNNKWKHAALYILLIYISSGFFYSIAGYIYRSIEGKEVVFTPLIGIPLDIIGWPWMVYADLKHIGTMPQDIVAFLSIAVGIIIFFIKRQFNFKKR